MNDSENIAPLAAQTPHAATKQAQPSRVGLSLSKQNTPTVKRTVSNASSNNNPSTLRAKRRALGDITNRSAQPDASTDRLVILPTKISKSSDNDNTNKAPVTRRKPPVPRTIPRKQDGSVLTPEQTPVPIPRDVVFEDPVVDLGLDPVLHHPIELLKRRPSELDSAFHLSASPPRESSPFSFDLDDHIIDTDIPLQLDDLLGPEDELLL